MLVWLPVIFLFFFGLAVGSHVNVLILRFGFTETDAPRSHCPQCVVQIPWYDLMPVVSYLALRGRCRSCGSRIRAEYLLVELVTGIVFAAAYLFAEPAPTLIPLLGFCALLVFLATAVAIVAYDIRHTLIPLPFVYVLAGSAALFRVGEALSASQWQPLLDAFLGAGALAGFFGIIVFVSRERGMGTGDVYIAATIGALLGVAEGVASVIMGVWIATVFYVLLMLVERRISRKTELPFAPWLFLGALVAFFAHISILTISDWLGRLIWH
jgi:prepilin signal peptidase PulO-like enzyme (type II secretory pathway)